MRKFRRDETRDRWFAGDAENFPEKFEKRAGAVSVPERNFLRDGGNADAVQKRVYPIPKHNGRAVGNEVRAAVPGGSGVPAERGRVREQSVRREQMRVRGIFHVREIDFVFPVADDAQFHLRRLRDDAREQVRISRAPNQMRAQRNRAQLRRVRGADESFRLGLRFRVRRKRGGAVRERLVPAGDRRAAENDARRARVHEIARSRAAARLDDAARSRKIRALEILVFSPNARFRRRVKNDVRAGENFRQRGNVLFVGNVEPEIFDAFGGEFRARRAPHGADFPSASAATARNRFPEKSSASCDCGAHGFFLFRKRRKNHSATAGRAAAVSVPAAGFPLSSSISTQSAAMRTASRSSTS